MLFNYQTCEISPGLNAKVIAQRWKCSLMFWRRHHESSCRYSSENNFFSWNVKYSFEARVIPGCNIVAQTCSLLLRNLTLVLGSQKWILGLQLGWQSQPYQDSCTCLLYFCRHWKLLLHRAPFMTPQSVNQYLSIIVETVLVLLTSVEPLAQFMFWNCLPNGVL